MIDPTLLSALLDAMPEPFRPYISTADMESALQMGVGMEHVGAYLNSQALKRRNEEWQTGQWAAPTERPDRLIA
jgi:hypothetical protein